MSYVKLTASFTWIGESAFDDNNLTSLEYDGTIQEWNGFNRDGPWNSTGAIKTIVCTDGTINL